MTVATHNLRHRHNERGRHMLRRAGYKTGGRVKDAEIDSTEPAKDVHKHESHLHKGEPKTKLKTGGPVSGTHTVKRLDKKPRGGFSAAANTRTEPLETLNKTPEFTNDYARGGRTKGKGHNISIKVVTPGAGGQGAAGGPQAAQQAFQAGVMAGAQAAKKAMAGGAGGGPGGPPMPPPGAPPGGAGMPPPGGMPPHPMPAPSGAGMPPMGPPPGLAGAPPMPMPGGRPPMKRGGRACAGSDDGMKKGGRVHMTAGAGGGEGRLEKTELQKRKD